jgi:predicted phosphodiesterase
MRVAVLADIHGNLLALEAALADVARLKVDRIVIAGDVVVGSPDSRACWERVKALGCPVLRGNHERYVFDLGTERARPEWSGPQYSPVHYAAAQLGAALRAELASLPATIRLPEAPDLLVVHGSARNDTDLVFPYTRDQEIDPMFAGVDEHWIARGHNHYAGVRLWRERTIVTTGAVGLPLDGSPSAQFALFERRGRQWRIEHRKVEYDVAAAERRFVETGYLKEAGPMAELFRREVVTASFHIVPFLKFQAELRSRGLELSLDDAIRKYFAT